MDDVRVAIATFDIAEFAVLHAACEASGHVPVAYVLCRSMRPNGPVGHREIGKVAELLPALPAGMDLLLPGTAGGLGRALAGYDLDLLVVYGFNWRIPAGARTVPRFGTINVHTSSLPAYRGPAPVLWAIRNGDSHTGITVHRMDGDFDTGPVLAQYNSIALDDRVSSGEIQDQIRSLLPGLLGTAFHKVVTGDPGEPQDDSRASYAGLIEESFSFVDWSQPRRRIHDQVRMFRYTGSEKAPIAEIAGRRVRIVSTSLQPGAGHVVECGDGPLWVTETVAAAPDALAGPSTR